MVSERSTDGGSGMAGGGTAGAAGFVAWLHSSLAVEAVAPAARFFEEAFGFEPVFGEEGMSDQIASMTGIEGMTCDLAQLRHPSSGHLLELIAFRPPAGRGKADAPATRPGLSHAAFAVTDLPAAIAAAKRLGAVALGRITPFAEGPCVYLRVPGGAVVELEEIAAR